MKELSIEEKAKRYDEAIEKFDVILNLNTVKESGTIFANDVRKILPELAESKDEKIRKSLLRQYKGFKQTDFYDDGITFGDVVSWFEKQVEPIDKIVKRAMAEKQRVLLTETNGDANIDWDTRSLRDVKLLLEYGLDYIKKLEKQSEQDNNEDEAILHRFSFYSYKNEPNILYLAGLYVNDEYRNKGIGTKILEVADEVAKSLNCHSIRLKTKKDSDAERLYRTHGYNSLVTEDKDEIWLEKQGEQKSVVIPKFKVGDWVIFNNHHESIYQIEKIENYRYFLRHYLGGTMSIHFDNELIRLWTIQDAKDGDVLYESYSNTILILRSQTCGWIKVYCDFWINKNKFTGTDPADYGRVSEMDLKPAAKEKRDLLFQKMKEAGYEWDAERKELKKIEWKPAEWEPQTGDTFRKKGTTSPTYHLCDKREDGVHFGFVENREIGIAGGEITVWDLKENYELVERLKPIEQVVKEAIHTIQPKVEWSEEDEKFVHGLIRGLKAKRDIHGHITFSSDNLDITKTIEWLESLKDRVQPQPKQEWSEEDEYHKRQILRILKDNGCSQTLQEKTEKWIEERLKSLRPQSHWKPTKEQLVSLKLFIERYPDYVYNKELDDLYNDLKAL